MTVDIGTTPQLFLDDLIVDETHALTSTLHQPAKYAGNPIMTPLYPWEGRLALYGTVWRNEETGRFRMWYQGYGGMGIPRMGDDTSDSPWKGFDARNLLYTIGYATSDDGVFWERPNLGLIEYKGSRDNNLVMLDAAYANIIKDPRDPDPDRLYKSLFFEARDPAGTPNMGDGVSVAFSPRRPPLDQVPRQPRHHPFQRLPHPARLGRPARQVRLLRPTFRPRGQHDPENRPLHQRRFHQLDGP